MSKQLLILETEKITEQKFVAKMAASVLTIFLSTVMLRGTTFAYFTDVQTYSVTNIVSAYYQLEVSVAGEEIKIVTSDDPYTTMCANDTTFVLKATGNASTGYCEINTDDETFKTKPIPKNSEFTVVCAAGKKITFTPSWVVKDAGEETDLTIGTIGASILIEEEIVPTQYNMHTVVEGETLQTIAEFYGITVEELCEYNDIPTETVLVPGRQIAIPGEPEEPPSEEILPKEEVPEEEIPPEENTSLMEDRKIE